MLKAHTTAIPLGVLSLALALVACDTSSDSEAPRQGMDYPGEESGESMSDSGVLDTGETFDDSGETFGSGGDEGGDDDGGCNEDTGHQGGETGDPNGTDTGEECVQAEPFDLGRLDQYSPGNDEGVIVDCDTPSGYAVSSWRNAEDQESALWVMGVYQTRSDHSGNNHPMGAGSVSWSRPGDNVLVLSAYEPTTWDVEIAEGGELTSIIAIGYHAQIVNAPEGVEVEVYSYDTGSCNVECGYSLPGGGGGCEGEDLVGLAEALSGRSLTGFDGCYDATTFSY